MRSFQDWRLHNEFATQATGIDTTQTNAGVPAASSNTTGSPTPKRTFKATVPADIMIYFRKLLGALAEHPLDYRRSAFIAQQILHALKLDPRDLQKAFTRIKADKQFAMKQAATAATPVQATVAPAQPATVPAQAT